MGTERRIPLGKFWVLLAIIFSVFPETIFGLLPSTMSRLVFAAVAVALVDQLRMVIGGFDRKQLLSPALPIVGMAGIYMLVLGILRGNETKFLTVDCLIFASLALGVFWGGGEKSGIHVRALMTWYMLVSAILIINILGLATGFIPASQDGARIFNYGLFGGTTIVSMLFPLVYCGGNCVRGSLDRSRIRLVALAGLGACVLAAFLAGTRSLLFVAMISVAVTAWLKMEGIARVCCVFSILILCVLFESGSVSNTPFANSLLFQRIVSTNLESSSRHEEVQLMFEQLDGNGLIGLGFGSRFWSPIDQEGQILVLSPHIAILTLWQKGGFIVFAMLVGVPLLWLLSNVAIRRGFSQNQTESRDVPVAVWSACCLVYFAQASISGGWQCGPLFLFGALASRAHLATRTIPYGSPTEFAETQRRDTDRFIVQPISN